MTTAEDRSEPRVGLDRLMAAARRRAAAPVDDAMHAAGRTRLVAAMSALPRRGRTHLFTRAALVAAAVAACALAATLWLHGRPLRYEVDDASRFGSNYVSAPDDGSAKVRFSDGSKVMAEPGTRLRIDETTSNGARILVERGTANAAVVHRARSGWLFMAGPFEVHVTGTRFTLGWDPQKEAVDLTLEEGSVEVKSPIGEAHFAVHAGQRFRASLLDGSTKVESSSASAITANVDATPRPTDAPPLPPKTAPVTAPSMANISAAAATTAAASPARGALEAESQTSLAAQPTQAARETWPERVRRGDFASVVASATTGGFDACLASCTAQELRALADAARYTSQSDLARQALQAVRKRFSGPQKSAAAFLLGRTHESNHQPVAADQWYRTYLDEAPNGQFAADALAGRVRVTAARDGQQAARPLALEYLRRFPSGAYAQAARALAGSD